LLFLRDAHWYRSKEALDRAKALRLTGEPHVTPDGDALLIVDMRGVTRTPQLNGPPKLELRPPALVMQGADGHDLMQLVGRDKLQRVEFSLDALGDLSPLVEYDHLPESRQDYAVYPRGHKLS
jgi:hypothetical protein